MKTSQPSEIHASTSPHPKQVVLIKADLEEAIREGIVTVDVATALWRRWRLRNSASIPPLTETPFLQDHVAAATTFAFSLLVAFCWMSIAAFSSGRFGPLALSGAAIVAAIASFLILLRADRNSRHFLRDTWICIGAAFFCVSIYGLCLQLKLSPFLTRPRIDVFGVVPQDSSLRQLILLTIAVLTLYGANLKFDSVRLRAAFWLCIFTFLDACMWWLANKFMSVESGRVLSSLTTCILILFLERIIRGHVATGKLTPVLLHQALIAGIVLFLCFYVKNSDISPFLLLVVAVLSLTEGFAKSYRYQTWISLAAICASVVSIMLSSFGTLFGSVEIAGILLASWYLCKNSTKSKMWLNRNYWKRAP